MAEENVITRYKDLSVPLKVLVVLDWILIVFYIIIFAIGFMKGIVG